MMADKKMTAAERKRIESLDKRIGEVEESNRSLEEIMASMEGQDDENDWKAGRWWPLGYFCLEVHI